MTQNSRALAASAAAVIVAVLAGCTTGPTVADPAPPLTTTESTPTREANPSRLPAATTVDAALFMLNVGVEPAPEFMSPSGNISCGVYGDTTDYAKVACYIAEHSWDYPPCDAPVCSALTIIDRSGTVGIRRRGGAELGFEMGAAVRTLQYGESLSYGDVTCVATEDGVFCEDRVTGHGFAVSRSTYDEY